MIIFQTFYYALHPASQASLFLLRLQLSISDICSEKNRPMKRFPISEIGQRTLLPFIVNYLYQCMCILAISSTACFCFQWAFIMKTLEFQPSNYHDKDSGVEI